MAVAAAVALVLLVVVTRGWGGGAATSSSVGSGGETEVAEALRAERDEKPNGGAMADEADEDDEAGGGGARSDAEEDAAADEDEEGAAAAAAAAAEGEVQEEPHNPGAQAATGSSSTATTTANAAKKSNRGYSVESYFVNSGGAVVEIDKEGSYKYVLLRVEDAQGGSALLVRGCPHKEGTHCKHRDAAERAKKALDARGFRVTVLGGGRITRHPSKKIAVKAGYISIFGVSKTFGTCSDCNKLACALVKAAYPDHGVKWSTEGYYESDEKKISDTAWTRC